MKKLFLIGAIIALSFTSCSEDGSVNDDSKKGPIAGVELPESNPDNPTIAGTSVTIKGKGFTDASEIWFRVATTRSTSDVKAIVTAFTSTTITFTVPDVVGSQSIVLKQDGKEQVLGEMFFAKEEVFVIVYDESWVLSVMKYDIKTGEFVKQKSGYDKFNTYYVEDQIISLNNTLYYIGELTINEDESIYETGIVKYDLTTNQANIIKEIDSDNVSIIGIVLIDDLLHAVKYDKTQGFQLVKIAENGNETVVNEFGQPDDYADFDYSYNINYHTFIYDKNTNTILFGGNGGISINQEDNRLFVVSLSLESNSVITSFEFHEILLVGSQFLTFEIPFDMERTEYAEINPITLEKGSVIGTGKLFRGHKYVNSLNLIFGYRVTRSPSYHYNLTIYDIATKTRKDFNDVNYAGVDTYFVIQTIE